MYTHLCELVYSCVYVLKHHCHLATGHVEKHTVQSSDPPRNGRLSVMLHVLRYVCVSGVYVTC